MADIAAAPDVSSEPGPRYADTRDRWNMAYQVIRSSDVPGEPRKVKRGAVLLCDTSASMGWQDTWTGKRRIDHLAEVLAYVLSKTKVQVLCSFNSLVHEHKLTTSVSLEEPQGGTD